MQSKPFNSNELFALQLPLAGCLRISTMVRAMLTEHAQPVNPPPPSPHRRNPVKEHPPVTKELSAQGHNMRAAAFGWVGLPRVTPPSRRLSRGRLALDGGGKMPPIQPARCRRYNQKPPNQTYRTGQSPRSTGTRSTPFVSGPRFLHSKTCNAGEANERRLIYHLNVATPHNISPLIQRHLTC